MAFPPQIPLGGPPLGGPSLGGPPVPGGGGGIPGQPDSPQVADLITRASDLLQQALDKENDPEDKALIADLIAKAHKFVGLQQKLVDQASGAGPGAKLIRKASPGY